MNDIISHETILFDYVNAHKLLDKFNILRYDENNKQINLSERIRRLINKITYELKEEDFE